MNKLDAPAGGHQIAWFRRDLRLLENPAWAAATQRGDEVTALFVLDPKLFDTAGPFRKAALTAHLGALDEQLSQRGGRLRIEAGDPVKVVPQIATETKAACVHFNRDSSPYAVRRDSATLADVVSSGHWGNLVHEPGLVLTQKGTLSRVFTPFWKVWDRTPMTPWTEGEGNASIAKTPGIDLRPVSAPAVPEGGEIAARARLGQFLDRIESYLDDRDVPAVDGTSLLSADLKFGTLSPREIAAAAGDNSKDRKGFVRQLAWRDWYAHLLAQNPTMTHAAIKPAYDTIQWRNDPAEIEAWKHGTTGYPIVDAGMRQLRTTGYMHNRVRMIVGSFLVKDLLVDWRIGERWFRHLLIDADVSQNAGNWQWVAGCGTDAAPYFRVFNPWLQSKKFDSAGAYIRRWVPELGGLDDKLIHEPAVGAPLDLAAAGVTLGDNYPFPIVDHAFARDRALATFKHALDADKN